MSKSKDKEKETKAKERKGEAPEAREEPKASSKAPKASSSKAKEKAGKGEAKAKPSKKGKSSSKESSGKSGKTRKASKPKKGEEKAPVEGAGREDPGEAAKKSKKKTSSGGASAGKGKKKASAKGAVPEKGEVPEEPAREEEAPTSSEEAPPSPAEPKEGPGKPAKEEIPGKTRDSSSSGKEGEESGPPRDEAPPPPREEPEDFLEGLSPRTRSILRAAKGLKDRLGHGAVTTGHLIAAILEEEAGIARDVFWDINAYPDMFVEEMSRIKEIPVPERGYWFDEKVALVVERAKDGAEALGSPEAEPEHLVLALLSLPEGHAAEILEEFAMDRDDLKAEILAHMGIPLEDCPDWEHETRREKSRRLRKQKNRK